MSLTREEEIIKQGQPLGSGANGRCYKVEGRVYKIMHKNASEIEDYAHPDRVARVWNEFFTEAYQGKFFEFAIAKSCVLENGKLALITPFIKDQLFSTALYDPTPLNDELKTIGRSMLDNTSDNVRLLDGFIVPIDFDLFVGSNQKEKSAASVTLISLFSAPPQCGEYQPLKNEEERVNSSDSSQCNEHHTHLNNKLTLNRHFTKTIKDFEALTIHASHNSSTPNLRDTFKDLPRKVIKRNSTASVDQFNKKSKR